MIWGYLVYLGYLDWWLGRGLFDKTRISHARDDMRAQRAFCVVGEGFLKADGGMSSISDTKSIRARFLALNCAQSVVFHRFSPFFALFGHFCALKCTLIRPSATFSRGEKGLRRAQCAAMRILAGFSSRDFQTACFT
ncbi:MAG: hypothetical protein WEB58_04315 [Planctomycetaceae bacterium]